MPNAITIAHAPHAVMPADAQIAYAFESDRILDWSAPPGSGSLQNLPLADIREVRISSTAAGTFQIDGIQFNIVTSGYDSYNASHILADTLNNTYAQAVADAINAHPLLAGKYRALDVAQSVTVGMTTYTTQYDSGDSRVEVIVIALEPGAPESTFTTTGSAAIATIQAGVAGTFKTDYRIYADIQVAAAAEVGGWESIARQEYLPYEASLTGVTRAVPSTYTVLAYLDRIAKALVEEDLPDLNWNGVRYLQNCFKQVRIRYGEAFGEPLAYRRLLNATPFYILNARFEGEIGRYVQKKVGDGMSCTTTYEQADLLEPYTVGDTRKPLTERLYKLGVGGDIHLLGFWRGTTLITNINLEVEAWYDTGGHTFERLALAVNPCDTASPVILINASKVAGSLVQYAIHWRFRVAITDGFDWTGASQWYEVRQMKLNPAGARLQFVYLNEFGVPEAHALACNYERKIEHTRDSYVKDLRYQRAEDTNLRQKTWIDGTVTYQYEVETLQISEYDTLVLSSLAKSRSVYLATEKDGVWSLLPCTIDNKSVGLGSTRTAEAVVKFSIETESALPECVPVPLRSFGPNYGEFNEDYNNDYQIGPDGPAPTPEPGLDCGCPCGEGNVVLPSEPAAPSGWTPELAVVTDGERRVQQVVDWFGSTGTKPTTGQYVGATGLEPLMANGVDIRGAAGENGDTGENGLNADMTRLSTDTIAIGSGPKTFTYAASLNLGWVVGTRLRSSASGTNYMEGPVTAVSSTSVTINVDLAVGSGSYSTWGVSIAGDRGATGLNYYDIIRKPIPSNVSPVDSSELVTWAYWRAKTGDFTDAGAGRVSQLNDLGGVINVTDAGVSARRPLYRANGPLSYNEVYFITDDHLSTVATNLNFPRQYIMVSVMRCYGSLLHPMISVDTSADASFQGGVVQDRAADRGWVRIYSAGKTTDFGTTGIGVGLQLVVVANPYSTEGNLQIWINGFPLNAANYADGQAMAQTRPVNIGAFRQSSAWAYSVNGFGLLEQFVIDISSVAFTGVWRQYVDGLHNFYLAGGFPTATSGQPQLYRFGQL